MKVVTALKLVVILMLVAFVVGCDSTPVEPADLVIINGKVLTIDADQAMAEAVAMKGEWIVAVGTTKQIQKYIDEATEVIDAEGRLVFPGFNDAHAHFNALDPDYIELRYLTDPNEITKRVAAKVAETDPGVLIYGGHWEHEMFTNKEWPTKALLDAVSPDNPVILRRTDGHSSLVNSYVLKASGITKDTPDPFGGEIQKDPVTGEPTGILKESATSLVRTNAVKVVLTEEEAAAKEEKGWKAAFDYAARLGVTSIQYPGGGNADFFTEWQEKGLLTARIDVAGRLTADPFRLAAYDTLRQRFPQEENWIRFGYMKGFIDGTLGSGTLLLFEPLSDEPTKTGLPQMTYEDLEKRVVACDAMGFQVGIHAIGTKANNWILNAYEKAAEVNGKRDARHRSEHAQILIDEDIPRFAELGVIASMQPTHCITDKRFAEKRVGLERCKGAYAWRRLLDAGAQLAFGTDYSVEPLEPMEGLYAAVSRKDRLGEEGDGWFPDQKLSMEEAIQFYTLGAAYAQFMEDRKGILKENYLADVLIVDQDLLTIPEEDIMKTQVDITIVGGKVVYQK